VPSRGDPLRISGSILPLQKLEWLFYLIPKTAFVWIKHLNVTDGWTELVWLLQQSEWVCIYVYVIGGNVRPYWKFYCAVHGIAYKLLSSLHCSVYHTYTWPPATDRCARRVLTNTGAKSRVQPAEYNSSWAGTSDSRHILCISVLSGKNGGLGLPCRPWP